MTILLATDDNVLVECGVHDKMCVKLGDKRFIKIYCSWAIGVDIASREHIIDPARWRGENRLGKILVLVREYIKSLKRNDYKREQSVM